MANKEPSAHVDTGKRDLLKLTAATAVAATVITTTKSRAQSVPSILVAPSPYLTPWKDQLPIMPVKAPVALGALTPRPKQIAAAGEVGWLPILLGARFRLRNTMR